MTTAHAAMPLTASREVRRGCLVVGGPVGMLFLPVEEPPFDKLKQEHSRHSNGGEFRNNFHDDLEVSHCSGGRGFSTLCRVLARRAPVMACIDATALAFFLVLKMLWQEQHRGQDGRLQRAVGKHHFG